MPKRKITARDLLADVRANMTDFELMDKYKLSAEGLQSVFNKLAKAGLITHAELDSRVSMADKTVDLGFVCPSCGYLRNEEFDQCPRCGFATPTYIKREREKDRRKKEPPAQPKKTVPARQRDVPAPTIALPSEHHELPARDEPPAPRAEENFDALAGFARTVKRSRVLVVAAIAAYAAIVVVLFAILLVMPSNSTISVAQTLVAVLVLQIPILVIVLASFMNLRLLAESSKLLGRFSSRLARRRPSS